MGKQKEKKQAIKKTRQIVFSKLSMALAEFKGKIKEKKFDNNLRKISRVLAEDIVKAEKKNKPGVAKIKMARKELISNQDGQDKQVVV